MGLIKNVASKAKNYLKNNQVLLGVLILAGIIGGLLMLYRGEMGDSGKRISILKLENGLEVILVSDSRFSDSAASLAVETGSIHNPKEHQGLAHFLEHMLFLGTEKYPKNNDYSRYLADNGGYANAYTSNDHTNYHFTVLPNALEGALDRFSQFFISPLLSEEYTDKEVKAVASEHAKNISSDGWRIYNLRRSIYDEDDPRRGFYTGNAESLKNVTPKVLNDFFLDHYSADNMNLSIVGPQPLEYLEELTKKYFSPIEVRDLKKLELSTYGTEPKQALRLVKVRSVKDSPELIIDFLLERFNEYYREQPLSAINHVLAHEGPGSLLSLLKEDELAVALHSSEYINALGGSNLSVSIELTPKGVEQYQEVLLKTIGVFNALKKQPLPEWLLKQDVQLSQLDFDFDNETSATRVATRNASSMVLFPLDSLPRARYGPTRPNSKIQHEAMQNFSAERMQVILADKNIKGNKTDYYYKTSYSYEEISGDLYKQLLNAEPDPRWKLPQPNKFIAKDTRLLNRAAAPYIGEDTLIRAKENNLPPEAINALTQMKENSFKNFGEFQSELKTLLPRITSTLEKSINQVLSPQPTLLLQTPSVKAFHLEDWHFRAPKSKIMLQFTLPQHGKNRQQQALTELYISTVLESLNELGYPLLIAAISYNLKYSSKGMFLGIEGYSDQLPKVLELLIQHMQKPSISTARFDSIKQTIRKDWLDTETDAPANQSTDFLYPLLLPAYHHPTHLAEASKNTSLEDVLTYAQKVFSSFQLEALIVGSLSPKKASKMLAKIAPSPNSETTQIPPTVKIIPSKKTFQFHHPIKHSNNFALNYYQFSPEVSLPTIESVISILRSPFYELFFNQLRTEQQLGYYTVAYPRSILKSNSLIMAVQSAEYSSEYLQSRIQAFIPLFVKHIENLPADKFEQLKSNALAEQTQHFNSLASLTYYNFKNIFLHENPQRRQLLAKHLQSITQNQVIDILKNTLQTNPRILQIHLVPESQPLNIKSNIQLPQ